MLRMCRHNKKRKTQKDKLNSEDDISTVLEEDEELGDSDALDNGIDTLINDVDALLESRERSGRGLQNNEIMNLGAQARSGDRVFGSLKKMDAPKELYDATALLLQSSLLDEDTAMLLARDIMELSGNGESSTLTDSVGAITKNADTEGATQEVSEIDVGVPETLLGTSHEANEVAEADETSAFLATSTVNEEMLKPSIFTMHSISASEEKDD